jgi:hypothetical protein
MRRAQAILVILTLASLPLILLGQTSDAPACNGMCCIRHSMHSGSSARTSSEGMFCHHGAAAHIFQCGMHSSQHGDDRALLAPLPPTILSAATALPRPLPTRDSRAGSSQAPTSGFLPLPFEPPRS